MEKRGWDGEELPPPGLSDLTPSHSCHLALRACLLPLSCPPGLLLPL